jgi:hypothetical protein
VGASDCRSIAAPHLTASCSRISVLDLNADGRLDVAALEGTVPNPSQSGTWIRLYTNLGHRRFRSRLAVGENGAPLPALPRTYELLAGDLDHNGAEDLLALDPDDDEGPGALLLAGLSGSYRVSPAPAQLSAHQPVRLADVNEDGRPELVATTDDPLHRGYPIVVAVGDGTGGFSTPEPAAALLYSAKVFSLADVNGDGHLDVVSADATDHLALSAGDGRGAFAAPRATPGTRGEWSDLDFADLNHDHRLDIAGYWTPPSCPLNRNCSAIRALTADVRAES